MSTSYSRNLQNVVANHRLNDAVAALANRSVLFVHGDRDRRVGKVASYEEQGILLDTNIWVSEQGFPEGEFGYELTDEATVVPLAVKDLACPTGLQE